MTDKDWIMTDEMLAAKIEQLQCEVYEMHEAASAPTTPDEYQEWQDWIVDQIRKTAYVELINENVIEILDEYYNAHMAAAAAEEVMLEEWPTA